MASKEAFLYEHLPDQGVRCLLCSHGCPIKDGARGICGVRENLQGTLRTLVYGRVIAAHNDPIEKKPLYHFLPGTLSYSIATVGCNFRCRFCQNADISQMPIDRGRIEGHDTHPEEIVGAALREGAASIAYTYTEPTVYFEFAHDTALLAADKGLRNVFVTNGYMSREALEKIHPHLHAANVDLKAFTDTFYKQRCGARLQPVLDTIARMRKMGIWVEVTTLLIPGLNDSEGELRDLAGFLFATDPFMPWHVSRFHPTYRLTDLPTTPVRTVLRAREIGLEAGLRYVYTGNIPGDQGEKTLCHGCGGLLVDRVGFRVLGQTVRNGCCPHCKVPIPGVWVENPSEPC